MRPFFLWLVAFRFEPSIFDWSGSTSGAAAQSAAGGGDPAGASAKRE
jgi:hypothetical protein